MSILKATLRHTLRRKWKLPLVVFLSGVALVALTNAYDVAGLTEEMEAVAEASRDNPGGQLSPEQLATIQGGAGMLFLFTALRLLFFFGVILVGFLMPGGLVANERQSGAIMLWAQHPMPLTRFYLHRYPGIQVANLTAQALFGITAALAIFPRPDVPASDLGFFAQICMSGVLACAISFAVSALGIRRAAFLTLAYFVVSRMVGGILGGAAALGSSVTLEWVRAALPFLTYPSDPIEQFVAGLQSGTAWDWGATGMVLYHFALWTAIALLGLRRIERKPLKF